MKKKEKQRPARDRGQVQMPTPKTGGGLKAAFVLILAASAAAAAFLTLRQTKTGTRTATAAYSPKPAGSLTFARDIAPIVFDKCSPCHRPGQSGPFSLLTCNDFKERAKTIQKVTQLRYMPPWLPEPGDVDFAYDRSLTSEQLGLLGQWLAEGAAEGRSEDVPALPKWPDEWQLGKPDLILSLPSAYTLAAEGRDVYRNFVVPIPGLDNRFVRAVEFHPGNHKVVHHAFIEIDAKRESRYLTGDSQPPGFDGMELPPSVKMPMGQTLGWQPGKPPLQSPEGLAWVLQPRSDLVLQLHLHPTGKPESVLPSVGLYFTDRPPTNTPFLLKLARYDIDIAPGRKDYQIENSYVLPVDVELMRINPHAHYLGKQLEGWAVLPDGTRKSLLMIKNWDFNWQGDYLYKQPVSLPKGTTLFMRFGFDNSAENIRNPNQPPKRVQFGLQTTDEMGELWFQLLPRNLSDLGILSKDFFLKYAKDTIEVNQWRLQQDPKNAMAHAKLGSALFSLGNVQAALQHLQAAAQLDPANPVPHSQLGSIYLNQKLLPQAQTEFEAVLRSNPQDYEAHGSLGYICVQQGRYSEAEAYFAKALEINPEDAVAAGNLKALRNARRSQR